MMSNISILTRDISKKNYKENNTYLSLSEALSLVTTSSVGNVGGVLALDGKEIL